MHPADRTPRRKCLFSHSRGTHAPPRICPLHKDPRIDTVKAEPDHQRDDNRPGRQAPVTKSSWNAGDYPDANRQRKWNQLLLARIFRTFNGEDSPTPDLEHFCSRHKSFPVKGRLYLHQDSRFEWPGSGTEKATGTCHALETHVGILLDGRVVACCLDYQGKISLGNIQEQSLDEILKAPLAQKLREGASPTTMG